MLTQKLEFFLPSQHALLRSLYLPIYGLLWGLLTALLQLSYNIQISNMEFLSTLLTGMSLMVCITYIGLFVYESIRPLLLKLHPLKVCIWVVSIFAASALLVSFMAYVALPLLMHGYIPNLLASMTNMLINIVLAVGITLLFLLFYLKRHKEMMVLQQMFDIKMTMQNEQIKTRTTPHFFFNTINGLVSLVETHPEQAVVMLSNISELFRASFSKLKEIGMDQEIHLCEIFLAIDEMRFQNKLKVIWELPDEDILYDMTICAMTLQSVIEKLLNHVVEHTVEEIELKITVTWEHHLVNIQTSLQLPQRSLMIAYDLLHRIDFGIQEKNLQSFFGEQASIISNIDNQHIITTIEYRLMDTAIDNGMYEAWDMHLNDK